VERLLATGNQNPVGLQRRSGVFRIIKPTLWEYYWLWAVSVTPGSSQRRRVQPHIRITRLKQSSQQFVQVVEVAHFLQCIADRRTSDVALEVPASVLAEVSDPAWTSPVDQQTSMADHGHCHVF
tara:strand:- start:103 stop:474 length:372 start_codon:yes stop_codon:yes gene_type:complete